MASLPDAPGIAARWEHAAPHRLEAERRLATEAMHSALPKVVQDAIACSQRRRGDLKALALPEAEAAWVTRARWAGGVIVGQGFADQTY